VLAYGTRIRKRSGARDTETQPLTADLAGAVCACGRRPRRCSVRGRRGQLRGLGWQRRVPAQPRVHGDQLPPVVQGAACATHRKKEKRESSRGCVCVCGFGACQAITVVVEHATLAREQRRAREPPKKGSGGVGDSCSKAHFFPVRSRARQEGRHVGSMFDEDRHTNRLTTVPTSPHDAEHAAPHPPLLRESDVAAGVRAAATRHGDGGRRGGGAGVRRSAQRRAHAAAGLRHGGARLRQVVQGGSRRAGGGLPPHRHRTGRRVVGILSLPLPSSSASATHDDAHRRAERAERNACWIDHWRRSTDSVEAEGSMLRPHANSGRSALKVAVV